MLLCSRIGNLFGQTAGHCKLQTLDGMHTQTRTHTHTQDFSIEEPVEGPPQPPTPSHIDSSQGLHAHPISSLQSEGSSEGGSVKDGQVHASASHSSSHTHGSRHSGGSGSTGGEARRSSKGSSRAGQDEDEDEAYSVEWEGGTGAQAQAHSSSSSRSKAREEQVGWCWRSRVGAYCALGCCLPACAFDVLM